MNSIMANRIRELRDKLGMTVDELANEAGLSQGYVSRLESGRRGKRGLTAATAERLALALKTSPAEVMGIPGAGNSAASRITLPHQMEEDAEPYDAQHDDLLLAFVKKRKNVSPYIVKSDALDQAGIHKGDIVFLDISSETVSNVQPLDPVLAQLYAHTETAQGASLAMNKTRTLLRQFVPPSLLITNTSGDNAPILNIDTEAVAIKGVIIGKHQTFRKPR